MIKKSLAVLVLAGIFSMASAQVEYPEPDDLPRSEEIETDHFSWFNLFEVPAGEWHRFRYLKREDADSLLKYRFLLNLDPTINLPEGARGWLQSLEQNDHGQFREPDLTNFSLQSRIQMKESSTGLRGSRIFNRLILNNPSGWEGGIVHEKDPHEQWLDYTSLYFQTKPAIPGVRTILLGDYRIQSGLGLLYGDLFPPMKGSSLLFLRPVSRPEIKPFRSAVEYGSLRGAAVAGESAGFYWLLAGSHRQLDGEGYKTTVEKSVFLVNPSFTGIHVTETERRRQNNIVDTRVVAAASKITEAFESGFILSASKIQLNHPSLAMEDVSGPADYPSGNTFQGGLHVTWKANETQVSGEMATDGEGTSVITGLYSKFLDELSFSTVFRRLNMKSNTWFSGPFSHGDPLKNNETGWYSGIQLGSNRYRLVFYTDYWSLILPDAMTGYRTKGNEVALHGQMIPQTGISLASSVRFSKRNEGSETTFTRKIKLQAEKEWNDIVSFRTRWDVLRSQHGGYGESITFRLGMNGDGLLSSRQQFSVFSCNVADSRPFVTEPELPGLLYFHAFYHQGWRFSQSIRWNPNHEFSFSVKWGITEITKIMNRESTVGKGVSADWSLQWEIRP